MCFENYYLVTQFGLPTKANHSWVHGRRPPSARACLGGSTSSLTALGDCRKKVVCSRKRENGSSHARASLSGCGVPRIYYRVRCGAPADVITYYQPVVPITHFVAIRTVEPRNRHCGGKATLAAADSGNGERPSHRKGRPMPSVK